MKKKCVYVHMHHLQNRYFVGLNFLFVKRSNLSFYPLLNLFISVVVDKWEFNSCVLYRDMVDRHLSMRVRLTAICDVNNSPPPHFLHPV